MSLDQLRSYYAIRKPAALRSPDAPADREPPMAGLPAGGLVRHEEGLCYVVESRRPSEDRHGSHAFADVLRMAPQNLAVLTGDPRTSSIDLSTTVFLDTETTGLGVGAGTYVFLVGAGYLSGDEFRVSQFLLLGPGHERAFLATLSSFLADFSAVVTFNGKSFDWPLLESRFIRSRMPPPRLADVHIDLLHPARRMWKGVLESCALKELESYVLDVEREANDVPGWQIPEMYFRYQRTGDGHPLARVFYHNKVDVLSLAALAVRLHDAVDRPLEGGVEDATEFLALGRIFERDGDSSRALACYAEAVHRCRDRQTRLAGLTRLGALQKRSRLWLEALATWQLMLELGGDGALHALVEMAKYHEHVEHNLDRALDRALEAQTLVKLRAFHTDDPNVLAIEHRLSRLVERRSRLNVTASAR